MLVVVPLFSPYAAAASTTSADALRLGEERVDGDDARRTGHHPPGQVGVGEVGERIAAEQHEALDLAGGSGLGDLEHLHAVVAGDETHLDCADDVAAAQRRAAPWRPGPAASAAITPLPTSQRMLGEVGPAGDDDDTGPWRAGGRCRDPSCSAATASVMPPAWYSIVRQACPMRPLRFWANSMIRLRRFCAASRSRRYSTGSSSLRSGASRTIVVGVGRLVDRGPIEAEQVDRRAVAHLRVHVRRADDVVGETRPCVRVLVGAARAAEHGDRAGAAGGLRLGDQFGSASERRVPRRRLQLVVDAHQRRTQSIVAVDRLEVEAAAIAQPTPVDRIAVDALVAQQLVAAATARRCGTRPRTWCTCSRSARGPTGEP